MPASMRSSSLLAFLLVLPACADRGASTGIPTSASAPVPPPSTISSAAPSSVATAEPAPSSTAVATAASADAPAEKAPCSSGMALIDRFCIDKWEAVLYAPGEDGVLAMLPHN